MARPMIALLNGALVALALSIPIALPRASAYAQEPSQATPAPAAPEPERERHPVLMYIPNRIFDVFDIVRLRARVGPGVAVSLRATELADLNMGGYASVFVGLPGPRGRPKVSLPIGIENFAGVEVSAVGGDSEEDKRGPHYGALEVGTGFQLVIVGVDLGVDAGEVVDLALGILFIDIIGDDY